MRTSSARASLRSCPPLGGTEPHATDHVAPPVQILVRSCAAGLVAACVVRSIATPPRVGEMRPVRIELTTLGL